jgi:hypothetical protein
MFIWLGKLIDKLSEFLAPRKGLLPILGMVLIVFNFFVQLLPATWVSQTNLFLHIGLILAIFGLMLAWAL